MLPLLLASLAIATEGMWLPEQMPELADELAAKGLSLDPASLADPLAFPLGAIVTTGGCSAAFVSESGLMATNHHCVERWLQQLSDETHNRHLEGFTATTQADELSVGPGAKVWVVESITDVSKTMLAGIKRKTSDGKRHDLIEANEKQLVATCEERPNRRCWLDRYDGGGTWRLVDALEIKDIRMVYAEPMGLGQFGGEIDNWMWPRHGADFAFVRAYVAPDGTSASFNSANVPFKPKHHLEVSTEGVKPGDFVMVAGYPGRTSRHVSAGELRFQAESYLPARAAMMRSYADILQDWASRDEEAAKRVGPAISRLENYYKNTVGTLEGLESGGLIEQKAADEDAMRSWVNTAPDRQATWGAMLDEQDAREALLQAERMGSLTARWAMYSSSLLDTAHDAIRWATERQKKRDLDRDQGYQDRNLERLLATQRSKDATLHLESEREVFTMLLRMHAELPPEQQVMPLSDWLEEHGGIDQSMDLLYGDPALASSEARLALFEQDLDTLRASTDPWVQLAFAVESWLAPEREASEVRAGEALRLNPQWFDLLHSWSEEQGRSFSHDANSSLRVTFGTVQGYEPADGLWAKPQTTLPGLVKKAGDAPFDAPADVVEAAQASQDSRWVDPNLGEVPVNFLADLDITGGNSGSSVLDAKGRWVGLAFDGNWESVAADWVYEDALNRCISLDMRYAFWLMERNEAGQRVLAELGIPAE